VSPRTSPGIQQAIDEQFGVISDRIAELTAKYREEQAAAQELVVLGQTPNANGGGALQVCPVAGLNSFVDSFGWPRVGHMSSCFPTSSGPMRSAPTGGTQVADLRRTADGLRGGPDAPGGARRDAAGSRPLSRGHRGHARTASQLSSGGTASKSEAVIAKSVPLEPPDGGFRKGTNRRRIRAGVGL
jgi:hypothetical protein